MRVDASSPMRSRRSRYGAAWSDGILDPGDRQRRRREIFAGRVHRLLELRGDLHRARLEMEGNGHQVILRFQLSAVSSRLSAKS